MIHIWTLNHLRSIFALLRQTIENTMSLWEHRFHAWCCNQSDFLAVSEQVNIHTDIAWIEQQQYAECCGCG
jgi:hypothetical protein